MYAPLYIMRSEFDVRLSKTIDSRTNKTWLGSTRMYAVVSRFRFVTIFFFAYLFYYSASPLFLRISNVLHIVRAGRNIRWLKIFERSKICSCRFDCHWFASCIRDCHDYLICFINKWLRCTHLFMEWKFWNESVKS